MLRFRVMPWKVFAAGAFHVLSRKRTMMYKQIGAPTGQTTAQVIAPAGGWIRRRRKRVTALTSGEETD